MMETSLPIAITNKNTLGDGLGENYKNVILTMALAEFTKKTFVYSPFENLTHSKDELDFDEKMEQMINLKKYIEVNDENAKKKYTIACIRKMDLLVFFDNNIEFFETSNTLKLLKTAFKDKNVNPWTSQASLSQNVNEKNIAIHIRRPDMYDANAQLLNKFIERLKVPVDIYVSIIQQLLSIYPDSKIHIYSQLTNNEDEFKVYSSINEDKIVLHIDEPLEKTFTEMVFADVLVTAPSSLSYIAGILSDNVIYYLSYCSPPLSHWNIIDGYVGSKLHYFTMDIEGAWVSYNSKTNKMDVANLEKYRC